MLLYTYISRFSVNPHYQQQLYLRPPLVVFFNFAHKRPMFAFASKSEYTLGFAQRIAHNGSHAEIGAFRMGGWYHYPRSVPHVHKHPRAGYQNGVLCRFWALTGGTPEERREPSEQQCAYARRGPTGLRDPVVRPLMLRFSVSVRKVSAQSPVNATRSSSHLNPSTTQPSSKNRTQALTRRNVCAFDVAILEVSCYTDGHRTPLKNFFIFFENRVRNGAARASI